MKDEGSITDKRYYGRREEMGWYHIWKQLDASLARQVAPLFQYQGHIRIYGHICDTRLPGCKSRKKGNIQLFSQDMGIRPCDVVPEDI